MVIYVCVPVCGLSYSLVLPLSCHWEHALPSALFSSRTLFCCRGPACSRTLVPDMAKTSPKRLTLSILAAEPQIWANQASKGSFWHFGGPCPRYGQNELQRAHFGHLGALVPDMARMSLESSFWLSGSLGPRHGQNDPQKGSFWASGSLAPRMGLTSTNTREAPDEKRMLRLVHGQRWPCWKGSIRWENDTQTGTQTETTLLIEKRAGRRPALQSTREASDKKRKRRILRQVRRQRWPCWLEKEHADDQLHKVQGKHQMRKGYSDRYTDRCINTYYWILIYYTLVTYTTM